jgi:hypothetical protein
MKLLRLDAIRPPTDDEMAELLDRRAFLRRGLTAMVTVTALPAAMAAVGRAGYGAAMMPGSGYLAANEMPLGLADLLQATTLHGLTANDYIVWANDALRSRHRVVEIGDRTITLEGVVDHRMPSGTIAVLSTTR